MNSEKVCKVYEFSGNVYEKGQVLYGFDVGGIYGWDYDTERAKVLYNALGIFPSNKNYRLGILANGFWALVGSDGQPFAVEEEKPVKVNKDLLGITPNTNDKLNELSRKYHLDDIGSYKVDKYLDIVYNISKCEPVKDPVIFNAFYSEQAAKYSGYCIYETADGRKIKVTGVTKSQSNSSSMWPDERYVGEVVRFIASCKHHR
jgi:hypothetical protein